MKRQNTSHTVMAQRFEAKESRDNFPTPPWATRALIHHVLGSPDMVQGMDCLEPACGAGHMSKVLWEYFSHVASSDLHPYGYGEVADFLEAEHLSQSVDWVITNPPFKLAEEFVQKSLTIARQGVAILARTVFIESVGRYERLFSINPPSKFAQFTERVAMVKGRLDPKASTATGYGWIVWEKNVSGPPQLVWVPPCRRNLEKRGDYDTPSSSASEEKRQLPTSVTSKTQLQLV